jgi:hypothetical protein
MEFYLSIRDWSTYVQVLAIHQVVFILVGNNLPENLGNLQCLKYLEGFVENNCEECNIELDS